jgi:hypothetical protein
MKIKNESIHVEKFAKRLAEKYSMIELHTKYSENLKDEVGNHEEE